MARLRLFDVDRLTLRIAVGMSLILIVPLAGGLYFLSRIQYDHAVEARRNAAELENRIVEAALRHDMVTRDTKLMADVLREVGRQPDIVRAMVVDHNGTVKLSSRTDEVGSQT